MKKQKYVYLLALLPFLAVAILYEIVPLCSVIGNSFLPDGGTGFSLENYEKVFTKLLYQKAIVNSLKISLTFSYMILLGNAGFMVHVGQKLGIEGLAGYNLYTSGGMSMIYVYFQIPLATLLLIPAFEGIRREWKEAVALLGGNMTCFWTKVGVPVLMPGILGTFSVLFANALAAYATVYALMMNNISLLPIQIAGSFVGEVKLKPGLGGALSVVMMAMMVIMIFVTNGISRQFQKGVKKV